jgi:hypothetical protein
VSLQNGKGYVPLRRHIATRKRSRALRRKNWPFLRKSAMDCLQCRKSHCSATVMMSENTFALAAA